MQEIHRQYNATGISLQECLAGEGLSVRESKTFIINKVFLVRLLLEKKKKEEDTNFQNIGKTYMHKFKRQNIFAVFVSNLVCSTATRLLSQD